jgi:7-keto-8-aminopelargonate synthetase-like enzyme
VPLYMRTQDAAQAFAASLRQSGITVSATTSPARPESVPRLRFIVRADHQERQLEACARLVDDLEGRTGAVRRAADGR